MFCDDILLLVLCGGFNLYGFLLLKYCGWVLINWVLVNGEIEMGVILYQMVKKVDVGLIVGQYKVMISGSDMVLILYVKMCDVVNELLCDLLLKMKNVLLLLEL